jgi:hypothetical protein
MAERVAPTERRGRAQVLAGVRARVGRPLAGHQLEPADDTRRWTRSQKSRRWFRPTSPGLRRPSDRARQPAQRGCDHRVLIDDAVFKAII